MTAFLAIGDVQSWLETTKMTVATIDAGIDTQCKTRIFGVLSARYDTATWTTTATTPSLVVQLVAMAYAAAAYRRQYSEDLENNPAWPVWLEQSVQTTLDQIISGALDLLDDTATDAELASPSSPSFYPMDDSLDDDGEIITAAFSMGQVF